MPRSFSMILLGVSAFAVLVFGSTAWAATTAQTQHLTPAALDTYVGSYQLAPGFVLKIFRQGDQLSAQLTGQGAAPIYPSAKDQFFYKIVDAQISFERNAAGKVTGLVLHQNGDHPASRISASRAAAAPASGTAWIAAAAVGAKTLPITVSRGDFVLNGVLNLPAGKGPFGIVDIIPGSGPIDINGNGGPAEYSMYKKLAAALVKAGWAVARVAKRGLPPSTGNGNNVVFNDQVADNRAIVETLRKNPHVDPQRIIVAGHSIGGLIAPKLAIETRIAGLILLEAPGESMTKITTAQVLEMNPGASAERRAAIEKEQAGFYQAVAKTAPGQSLSYAAHKVPAWEVRLLKSVYAQQPLTTARKVRVPVLVVQGGMDFNVPPGNGKRLLAVFPHATLLYVPKMGHLLNAAPCRCLKQMLTGTDASLAPGLTAGIARWLKTLPQ